MKTINPANGEVIEEYANMSLETVNRIIADANRSQKAWSQKTVEERALYINEVAEIIRDKKEDLARLMTMEMGKPIQQARGEIEKCAWLCDYYADKAAGFLSDIKVETDAEKSYVTFNALGTVLAVMPWNFPFWQVFRFGIPALLAGNAVVLSHSENTTGCSLKIEQIFHDAGIPSTLFRSILVPDEDMKPVVQHDGIAAVTLTGSTRAGSIVAAQAAEKIKKTVLELGGSDPYLIFPDANIAKAAETCVTSRFLNSGQSCIAAKRFIVFEEVYDSFINHFEQEMKKRQIGDPANEENDIGPMARADLRDQLHDQVMKSIDKGAKLRTGGNNPGGDTAFYPLTILENVMPGMPAYEEELFGPVASFIRVKDEEEAIRVANDTHFGLGAAIFSKNVDHAERLAAEKLEAGCCFVNDFVKSDPRLPFGGVKKSGYGRELGEFGIREFVNIKTVYIA